MKPTVVVDEMFPEGAGPYMELEEVCKIKIITDLVGKSLYALIFYQAGASSAGILMDLAANEKDVHSDFFNGKTIIKLIFLR